MKFRERSALSCHPARVVARQGSRPAHECWKLREFGNCVRLRESIGVLLLCSTFMCVGTTVAPTQVPQLLSALRLPDVLSSSLLARRRHVLYQRGGRRRPRDRPSRRGQRRGQLVWRRICRPEGRGLRGWRRRWSGGGSLPGAAGGTVRPCLRRHMLETGGEDAACAGVSHESMGRPAKPTRPAPSPKGAPPEAWSAVGRTP